MLLAEHENVLELTAEPAGMREMTGHELRIVDANLNRIAEGLRVLEEVARLALNDVSLSQKLKDMRHDLSRVDWRTQQQLLASRDAGGDVGADLEVAGEGKQRDLPGIIIANARRVQESLRVMEEMSKMPGLGLDSDKFRHTRFSLYTIEKDLIAGLLARDKE